MAAPRGLGGLPVLRAGRRQSIESRLAGTGTSEDDKKAPLPAGPAMVPLPARSGGGPASPGGVIVLDDGGEEEEEEEEAEASAEGPAPPSASPAAAPPPPQANGRAASDAAPGKDPGSLRAENQRLFQQFVDLCSQHTTEHPEVMPYLASRHQKTSPQFLASAEFHNVLGRCLTRVQAKRSKVYVYINELCTIFKAHSQKRKLVPASAAAEASAAPTGPLEPPAEPPKPQGGSKRQIRYLENLLQVYAVEIRRLQERELDLEELDREDSAYLQEGRLKRRMMRIFDRLCQLKDCNSLTGRVIEQRIPYRGTRYPEVNRRIERLINHPEAFPDYNDILKVVLKANNRHSLGLPKRQMESMAADAFREVGNRLQERRHLDLVYNFGSHLTDQYRPGSDPALADGELARRLRQNREQGLQRLDQVVSHYAQLQDRGEEEEWRRKRGQPPSSTAQQGEPASPSPSAAASKEGSLSPRAARKEALQAEEEEDEEEEESSSESDIEAELAKSLEGSGEEEEEEEGLAPDDEDLPGQEVEADQRLDPEAPAVILYSSTEEEEEEEEEEVDEEEEDEAAAARAERGDEAQPGGDQPSEPPAQLFVPEVQGTLALEDGETPSPPPWTPKGGFPLPLPVWEGPPPVKRSRALENRSLCPTDHTSIPEEPNGQPPRKRGRQEQHLSKSPLSSSCIEVPSAGSSEEEGEGLCSPPASRSPAPVADSTWADSPGLALVTSSQGSPVPICKTRGLVEGIMDASVVHVDFPEITSALLENLNQQRLEGKLCDISIHVQGRVFRAHRAVLAASSPYFHDQVLLKNMMSIVLPSVMDPVAFETVLGSAYTGKLSMASDEIVNYLTVGSVLQMWHIVDKCTELLKERRGALLGPSSSSSSRAHSSRTSDNQSPSSSNYFSPRDSGDGPEPGKYNPRGGVSSAGEREGSEDHEEEVIFQAEKGPSRCPDPFAGGSKFILETDDDISDSGETGSCEGRRPAYVRPSIMPQKQWVFIKKERSQEDLVLTCEEDEDPVEVAGPAPEAALSITDVRTLTNPGAGSGGGSGGNKLEEQVNFCESSEDFPSPYEALEDASPLPGSFPQRSLMPMDMQGNQILVFPPQAPVEHGAVQLAASSGDGNKIFMCHCGKAFSHKSMRDRHVNMHLNLRPFDCPVCNKKFKMKHHLTEHMKTHTGLKPYECDVCAKKFMWRDSFMRHKGHCERRHRLGAGGGTGTPVPSGAVKKEASPSPISGDTEWAPRRSPRGELGFAGSSKM